MKVKPLEMKLHVSLTMPTCLHSFCIVFKINIKSCFLTLFCWFLLTHTHYTDVLPNHFLREVSFIVSMSCDGTCSQHDHVGTRRVHQWRHHDSAVHLFCCSSRGQCDLRNPRRSSNQPSQRVESIQQINDKSSRQTSHGRGCDNRGGSVKDGVKLREITG